MENNNSTAKTVGAIAITAILLIGIYIFILNNKPATKTAADDNSLVATTSVADTTPVQSNTVAPTDTATATDTPTASVYTDGSYTATGSYAVPEGGTNSITVTLTVKDDAITAVKTTNKYVDRESVEYINAFDSGISGTVVGKKLPNAKVGRVNGSSLTGNGFNTALNSIISQAKA